MMNLPGLLGTLTDLLIVVVGFGLIVFVHELGHFLAARWAGIRVLTFAVGFGPALVSYRRGLGFRRGSSEREYHELLNAQAAGATINEGAGARRPDVSPTEYRLAALPLGGFVRMLGQDDLDPGAVSDASDSYQQCKPWKRMVVISAGVVMNIITAAILFIAVFMIGIEVEPPRVGMIRDGSPAAIATAVAPSGERVGLKPGDEVLSVNGEVPRRFDAVLMAVAMSDPNTPTRLIVQREGMPEPLSFDIEPEASSFTGLLDLGIGPPQTLTFGPGQSKGDRKFLGELLERSDLDGVELGMTLTRINDIAPESVRDVVRAFEASNGEPVRLAFEGPGGERAQVVTRAKPAYEVGTVAISTGGNEWHTHVLGLAGVMMVSPNADAEEVKQGLKPGDIFERVGTVEFPSLARGIEEIRSHTGRSIDLVVRRANDSGGSERVTLTASVNGNASKRNGTIGFLPADTSDTSALLSLPVRTIAGVDKDRTAQPTPPAGAVITRPGTRIVSVAGVPTLTLDDVRTALQDATADAAASRSDASVELELELPTPDRPVVTIAWDLDAAAVGRLHALGWEVPFETALFAPERMILRAEGPVAAIGLGLGETKRVMTKTYLTFARLFQGSVKVEHLKGPVGIAHIGTRIAERGPVWLMFFMALISVNLAVINFLPLPIVDGGQFLMLLYEQIRGRPVPIAFQNAVTLAGLVLIGGAFLFVTFNDVKALFGL